MRRRICDGFALHRSFRKRAKILARRRRIPLCKIRVAGATASFENVLLDCINVRNGRSPCNFRANCSQFIADFGECQNDSAPSRQRERNKDPRGTNAILSFISYGTTKRESKTIPSGRSPFLPFAIIAKLILIIGTSSTRARVPFIRFETRVGG